MTELYGAFRYRTEQMTSLFIPLRFETKQMTCPTVTTPYPPKTNDLTPQDETMRRSTSPRLYAQVAQFPTCSQLRIWRRENGIPVGLGVIDSQASEEDLIREFASAMPKPGEGKIQFKLRAIDITGQEMGQEINLTISEHHPALQRRPNK